MTRLTVREAVPIVAAAGVAAYIGYDLADHNVGVSVIVSVVLALLSTGMSLGIQFQKAAATQLFTCPEPGCSVQIRATNQPDDRLARLRELATDHTHHTEIAGLTAA
ncbi:hypothetical protein ACIP2Y_10980 [Streptomyces sviceus]|uniref:hypothetical protein n=1 Tax=Streptomyces sviceus TaxID=285530 RepID=UPI0038254A83